MAEGDTIKRARLRLEPILKGYVTEEFWAKRIRGHKPRSGHKIADVRSVGKHLLIDFENGLTLDTHMGMDGYWKVQPGKPAPISEKERYDPYLKVIITTSSGRAMCYKAPTVQTFLTKDKINPVSKLGPDLSDPKFDMKEVMKRAKKQKANTPIIDVLMDQSVACGIGNIYKSESLHIQKINPFTKIEELDDPELEALYLKAAKLLQQNARTGTQRRKIAPNQDQFFVYKRFKAPCKRCDSPIERSYEGKHSRSTYWCEMCQPKRLKP